ncbi:hypothetical protein ACFPIF_19395 [Brevundimonas faecalis]|uniref:hypothetical protein n=1 Tax=Brevundimonas faecalis TaxID=947378 RepID=UPI00360AFEDA
MAGPYLAAAGQTDFPADFPLLKSEGLYARIERGGAVVRLGGDQLEAVAVAETGFICRLAVPSAPGDRVWIYSCLPTERDRAHTPNGAVRTRTLEDDAEELQAQHQEARRDLGRALMFPLGEAPAELPLAIRRRSTIPVFDGAGALIVVPALTVLNEIGMTLQDDGAWGAASDPLTHDDGAFA